MSCLTSSLLICPLWNMYETASMLKGSDKDLDETRRKVLHVYGRVNLGLIFQQSLRKMVR